MGIVKGILSRSLRVRPRRLFERWRLMGEGDPSLRLKDGSVQDDASGDDDIAQAVVALTKSASMP